MVSACREAGVTIRPTLPCHYPLTHTANWPTSTQLRPSAAQHYPGAARTKIVLRDPVVSRQQPGACAGSVPEHAAQPNEHPESEQQTRYAR